MNGQSVIDSIDQAAIAIPHAKPDMDLYEFDVTLWKLLSSAANEEPSVTAQVFGLKPQTVELLANADPSRLDKIASGSLLSFRLAAMDDEKESVSILESAAKSYRPEIAIYEPIDRFAHNYWTLLKRLVVKDKNLASQQFCISYKLLNILYECTDSQIYNIATKLPSSFRLRFQESLIQSLLFCDEEEFGFYLMLKIQQSIFINDNF